MSSCSVVNIIKLLWGNIGKIFITPCYVETTKMSNFNKKIFLQNPGLFFVYFHSFLVTISFQTEKSVDGVLGIQTWGCRMVGADETMELWWPPKFLLVCSYAWSRWYRTPIKIFFLTKSSVTRLGDLLHFGQVFKSFGNN